MQLIFIRKVGEFFNGDTKYELIFSDDIYKSYMIGYNEYNWDSVPASGNPTVFKESVVLVAYFETSSMDFDLIQDNDYFSMCDAKDGIIPLMWENIENKNYTEIEKYDRIFFNYGEEINSIKEKLYSYDINLKIKQIK